MTDKAIGRQRVIDDLLVLIRRFAVPTLLLEIAEGDSQAAQGDGAKHLAALHELRDRYDWGLHRQPDNGRYPCEPIKLISYAVDHHSLPAQVFCNALLIVAELQGADQDDMHFRWFEKPGEAWYRRLNAPWHDAMIAGFAWLHSESSAFDRAFWAKPDAKGKWIEPEGGFDD